MIMRNPQDRRADSRSWPISGEQRRQFDRRGRAPAAVPVAVGAVRAGYGEVPPPRERRQRPESGME